MFVQELHPWYLKLSDMSLTSEQVIELKRLNELFRRFEAIIDESFLDDEEIVHHFRPEGFLMVNAERAHLQRLADKRQALFARKNTTGPLQTIPAEGDIRISFD